MSKRPANITPRARRLCSSSSKPLHRSRASPRSLGAYGATESVRRVTSPLKLKENFQWRETIGTGRRTTIPKAATNIATAGPDSARDRPFTAAAAVGGAVAAGVFLWSRRNQISDQIGKLGEIRSTHGATDFRPEEIREQRRCRRSRAVHGQAGEAVGAEDPRRKSPKKR